MQLEKSCGGVVFTRENGEVRYVIIRHRTGHCGFPKGHMEPGETEAQTALREIREEVGLSCTLLEGFRQQDQYPLPGKPDTMKQVVYFLAEFENQDLRLQPEEIAETYLLTCEEAMKMLPFPEARRILTAADAFLHKTTM